MLNVMVFRAEMERVKQNMLRLKEVTGAVFGPDPDKYKLCCNSFGLPSSCSSWSLESNEELSDDGDSDVDDCEVILFGMLIFSSLIGGRCMCPKQVKPYSLVYLAASQEGDRGVWRG